MGGEGESFFDERFVGDWGFVVVNVVGGCENGGGMVGVDVLCESSGSEVVEDDGVDGVEVVDGEDIDEGGGNYGYYFYVSDVVCIRDESMEGLL